MKKNLSIYTVSFDGLDKTGKSTLVKYLAQLSHFTLCILDRGPITNIVWNKIQKREIEYDLEMWRNTLFVRLTADEDDWNIRCKIHQEPPMPLSYSEMSREYDDVFAKLKAEGFHAIEFNTSRLTQIEIAKQIIETLEKLNTVQH